MISPATGRAAHRRSTVAGRKRAVSRMSTEAAKPCGERSTAMASPVHRMWRTGLHSAAGQSRQGVNLPRQALCLTRPKPRHSVGI